jgi:hypothetical protein
VVGELDWSSAAVVDAVRALLAPLPR